jgi:molybdopterin molybdotransferase
MLSYEAARAKVIEVICTRRCAPPPPTETIEFAEDPSGVLGRIVAEDVRADRNYPPFNRSTRDGFALRAADAAQAGAQLRLIGESRAGVPFAGIVEPGTCVQIMTGAAMPRGANSIVMRRARARISCWKDRKHAWERA